MTLFFFVCGMLMSYFLIAVVVFFYKLGNTNLDLAACVVESLLWPVDLFMDQR